jgi:hypothetical protein
MYICYEKYYLVLLERCEVVFRGYLLCKLNGFLKVAVRGYDLRLAGGDGALRAKTSIGVRLELCDRIDGADKVTLTVFVGGAFESFHFLLL